MTRETFATSSAPAPVANYSQACAVGPIVAAAGQVGLDPATGELAGEVGAQTELAMRNHDEVLAAAGCSRDDIVRMDCYLTTTDDFAAFNEVYARWFPSDSPARTTVIVGLAPGLLVEVTALAVRP